MLQIYTLMLGLAFFLSAIQVFISDLAHALQPILLLWFFATPILYSLAMVPERFRCLPVVGRIAYWALRLGYPWNTRLIPWLLARMGRDFPVLTNHFFVLRPSLHTDASRRDTFGHGQQVKEELVENAP